MLKLVAVIVCAWVLVACGGEDKKTAEVAPCPQDKSWAVVKPIVDAECGRCHDGAQQTKLTKANFGDLAKAKIASGAMPKDRALDPAEKAALLAYF